MTGQHSDTGRQQGQQQPSGRGHHHPQQGYREDPPEEKSQKQTGTNLIPAIAIHDKSQTAHKQQQRTAPHNPRKQGDIGITGKEGGEERGEKCGKQFQPVTTERIDKQYPIGTQNPHQSGKEGTDRKGLEKPRSHIEQRNQQQHGEAKQTAQPDEEKEAEKCPYGIALLIPSEQTSNSHQQQAKQQIGLHTMAGPRD